MIPDSTTGNSGDNVVVADKFSRAYEGRHCSGALEPAIRPNYSSIVCVAEDTRNELILRGWIENKFYMQR
jgi:hypothetical protein